jgi:transposase-like protein
MQQLTEWVDFPRSAVEFEERFGSEDACYAYLAQQRWPDGFQCPRCGQGKAWRLTRRRLLECRDCSHQTSVTAGTVFHRTRRPLRLWFRAMLLMTCQHSGVSARNLRRQLGLGSYQTAWLWLHKLRRAMVSPTRQRLSGQVEVDETLVGGPEDRMAGRKTLRKAGVVAAVEIVGQGSGRLRMGLIENFTSKTLTDFVIANVDQGSLVKTDGWSGYFHLPEYGYRHRSRPIGRDSKKASKHFPRVHRAFSLFKRWLLGTHQGGVQPWRLPAYLDEFVFRYNRRSSRMMTLPFQRLCAIAVATPPLTYRQLVVE